MSRAIIIAAIVSGSQPANLAAPDLVRQLVTDGLPPDAAGVLALAPQVSAALVQVEETAKQSYRMVEKCLHIKPTHSPQVPAGF